MCTWVRYRPRNTALQCTSVEWHECTCTPHMAPRPQAPNQTRWCTSDPQPANLLNCENQAVVNQVSRMCAKTSNNGCKRTAMSQSINPMSNSKAGSKLVALVHGPLVLLYARGCSCAPIPNFAREKLRSKAPYWNGMSAHEPYARPCDRRAWTQREGAHRALQPANRPTGETSLSVAK